MRRGTRLSRSFKGWTAVLGLLLVVSIAAGIPYAFAGDSAKRPPLDAQPVVLNLPDGVSPASLQTATVSKIIDGDTIDVLLDGKVVRVRYYGVDTPERGDRCFREATDRNGTLVGKQILLLPDAREQDPYGRLLRYIFLADGTSVDATLVAEGFGRAWTQDGRYKSQIVDLQQQAETADRGCLWK